MKIKKENTALLIIDLQEKLIPSIYKFEDLLDNTIKLIKGCRILNIPIIVSEQYPKGLGKTIDLISNHLGDFQPITKTEFSCMENLEFQKHLKSFEKRNIIVCGIEAHICVQQTVLDLMDKDYKPIIIYDCISSRNKFNKKIAFKRMRDYGSDFTTCEGILFELLLHSKSNEFKSISEIVK